MAAHRYWRAVAMEAYGAGDLELSCFHLLDVDGVRVDTPATLTASTNPTTGALANLQDDDLTTAARWPVQSVATLTLSWDFGGSPVDVVDVRLAGDDKARYLIAGRWQYSDDSVTWVGSRQALFPIWPGVGTLSASDLEPTVWSPTLKGTSVVLNAGLNDATVNLSQVALSKSYITGTGTYQFEVFIVSRSDSDTRFLVGVATKAVVLQTFLGGSTGGFSYFGFNGSKYLQGVSSAYGSTFTVGDTIGVVVNFDAGSLTFYKNGVSQGIATTGLVGPLYPAVSDAQGAAASKVFRLRGSGFTYPVAGADPWVMPSTIVQGVVSGRTTLTDPITVGTGPTIIYGVPQINDPVNLTIESGSVKDYTSGVLGTGRGRVSGTVKETPASPVYRKVRLIREIDGLLIRELWSHPVTGAYSFDYVDELQKFTVLSYDHTGAFRAVVASGITPELIP